MIKKVLIIDDDQAIIDLLSNLSAKFFEQAEIIIAQSKEKALAIISSMEDIDLAIIEFSIGGIFSRQTVRVNGLEVASQIKQLSTAKLIVLTSVSQVKKDFIAIGADYFINSNFDSKKLSIVFSELNQRPAP